MGKNSRGGSESRLLTSQSALSMASFTNWPSTRIRSATQINKCELSLVLPHPPLWAKQPLSLWFRCLAFVYIFCNCKARTNKRIIGPLISQGFHFTPWWPYQSLLYYLEPKARAPIHALPPFLYYLFPGALLVLLLFLLHSVPLFQGLAELYLHHDKYKEKGIFALRKVTPPTFSILTLKAILFYILESCWFSGERKESGWLRGKSP